MIIKKDIHNINLFLFDQNKLIFKNDYIGAEYVIIFDTKPIIITIDDDKYLYKNLSWLFNNEYIFDNNGLSYKNNDEIRWLSDQSCDIENKDETDRIDRIIIKKSNESFYISGQNPFYEKNNIKKAHNIVAFSPAGNGFYSKNIVTGTTFQDDFIIAVNKSILGESLLEEKTTKIMTNNIIRKRK